jgi:hypothetical protein
MRCTATKIESRTSACRPAGRTRKKRVHVPTLSRLGRPMQRRRATTPVGRAYPQALDVCSDARSIQDGLPRWVRHRLPGQPAQTFSPDMGPRGAAWNFGLWTTVLYSESRRARWSALFRFQLSNRVVTSLASVRSSLLEETYLWKNPARNQEVK